MAWTEVDALRSGSRHSGSLPSEPVIALAGQGSAFREAVVRAGGLGPPCRDLDCSIKGFPGRVSALHQLGPPGPLIGIPGQGSVFREAVWPSGLRSLSGPGGTKLVKGRPPARKARRAVIRKFKSRPRGPTPSSESRLPASRCLAQRNNYRFGRQTPRMLFSCFAHSPTAGVKRRCRC